MKTNYLPGRARQGLPYREDEKGVYGTHHRMFCGPKKRSMSARTPARSRKHRQR